MRLLILGGTVFVGRHLAACALDAGAEVTLFHRGLHNPDLFPRATKLRGDRDADLRALQTGEWDVVVDTSGYLPRVVRKSARLLSARVGMYVFISSLSVYARPGAGRIDESSEIARLPEGSSDEEVNPRTYGPLKALCEQAVESEFAGRALIVRPGLIVGPHDPTDRFTYWPRRIAGGGEILAPGKVERLIQCIDVRDLAEWIMRAIERKRTGIFNATGPAGPLTMGKLLETCQEACDSRGRLVWVPDEFLEGQGLRPYLDLPLWIPREHERYDCRKAREAGLTHRPLRATVWDSFAWDLSRPFGTELKAGLSSDREVALLRAWRALSHEEPMEA